EKIVVSLVAPNAVGDAKPEKIEFLGDGQQLVVAGIHPDTKQPYRWHGGELGRIRRDDLPLITADEARALVEELVELLIKDFGYSRTRGRRRKGGTQAEAAADSDGAADWADLFTSIRDGHELHDSLCALAAKLAKAGTHHGAIVNQLRAVLE